MGGAKRNPSQQACEVMGCGINCLHPSCASYVIEVIYGTGNAAEHSVAQPVFGEVQTRCGFTCMTKGVFGIDTPEGWYKKLQSDYKRLIESPEVEYAAIDFFVTAEGLRDWAGVDRKHHFPVRVCSHIANSIKHENINRHDSVKNSRKERWVEAGWVEDGWVSAPLIIELTEDEAAEYRANRIEASDLAKLVMDFWGDWFSQRTPPPESS